MAVKSTRAAVLGVCLQVCVFAVAAGKVIVRAHALAATYDVSLTTGAFAVSAPGERSAFIVALAAVFVVVVEVDALSPAPGKTFGTIVVTVATIQDQQRRQNADMANTDPRHV
ncbi:hypothetical protein ACFL2F_02320 [Myxococcota bacterium]